MVTKTINISSACYTNDDSRVQPKSNGDVIKDFESLSLKTESSQDNKMWFKPPKEEEVTYVFFGGSEFDPYAENYQRHFASIQQNNPKVGIMIVSYPGFAGSKGSPSEKGCIEAGEAAMAYLKSRSIPEKDMILSGYSLGSAVALDLATKHPKIRKLNLISPIDTIIEPAKRIINSSFPSITRPMFNWIADNWFGDRFDNLEKVSKLSKDTDITIQVAARDHMRRSSESLMRALDKDGKAYEKTTINGVDHMSVISSNRTSFLAARCPVRNSGAKRSDFDIAPPDALNIIRRKSQIIR